MDFNYDDEDLSDEPFLDGSLSDPLFDLLDCEESADDVVDDEEEFLGFLSGAWGAGLI
jgi:hypothetical protein